MKPEDKATLGVVAVVAVCFAGHRFLPDYVLRSVARAKARKMRKSGWDNTDIRIAADKTGDVYLNAEAYK